MATTLIAIDPSIRACGYCLMKLKRTTKGKFCSYMESGNLKTYPVRNQDWVVTMDEMINLVCSMFYMTYSEVSCIPKCERVVIEIPSQYDSGRGRVARRSGSILKLHAFCYVLRARLMDCSLGDFQVNMVGVSKWKGQVPKRITQNRIDKHWGVRPADHNECDAIGIADYYATKILKMKRTRV